MGGALYWQSKLGVAGIILCILSFSLARIFYDNGWYTIFYICAAYTFGYVSGLAGLGIQQMLSTKDNYFKRAGIFEKIFFGFCMVTLVAYVLIGIWAGNEVKLPGYFSFVSYFVGLFFAIGFESLADQIEGARR